MFNDQFGEFSWKKFWFQVGSALGLGAPWILLILDKVSGGQILDYYQVVIPSIMFLYGYGKYIDGKNKRENGGNHDQGNNISA